MSQIFGRIQAEMPPAVGRAWLEQASQRTIRYATGTLETHTKVGVACGCLPWDSHPRQRVFSSIAISSDGSFVAWDGRLDRARELAIDVGLSAAHHSDAEIVLRGFERYGHAVWGRLVGEWAVALWHEPSRTLHLVRDHAGTRTLYIRRTPESIEWATYMDTFAPVVQIAELSDEYLAVYLSGGPVRELTPFRSIQAVLPAHVLTIRDGQVTQQATWWSLRAYPSKSEEPIEMDRHFRELLVQAVERRFERFETTIAELSGGMDSTSIVCASDWSRRSLDPAVALIDTISYDDPQERSLDERRYFEATERSRGKRGIHLEFTAAARSFRPHNGTLGLYLVPGADAESFEREQQVEAKLGSRGYRAVLSGLGGDELLGGVPDAFPELSQHLLRGRFCRFLQSAYRWSLIDRVPLVDTIRATIGEISTLRSSKSRVEPVEWASAALRSIFRERQDSLQRLLTNQPTARDRHFQLTWWSICDGLSHGTARLLYRPEYRYPLLDRELVEFVFQLPPDELQQPGRRRFMMRRALRGIVPEMILERRRKAFQIRGPMIAIRTHLEELEKLIARSNLAEAGHIDALVLQRAVRGVAAGDIRDFSAVSSAIALELWLQSAVMR